MVDVSSPGSGPLDGLVVVDLSRAVAGPHATMMLADMGARVIKIESPQGDDSRRWGPPNVENGTERESTYFLSVNRNKESAVLNLTSADDRHVLEQLLRRADVLVENFRAGRLARLGFPTEHLWQLNPGLILEDPQRGEALQRGYT
jgi:crotonobetainyl-CoA:carnitine CoA-transferase CaiB-like acyl-CoA transferase